jgi:hypothetical protein
MALTSADNLRIIGTHEAARVNYKPTGGLVLRRSTLVFRAFWSRKVRHVAKNGQEHWLLKNCQRGV